MNTTDHPDRSRQDKLCLLLVDQYAILSGTGLVDRNLSGKPLTCQASSFQSPGLQLNDLLMGNVFDSDRTGLEAGIFSLVSGVRASRKLHEVVSSDDNRNFNLHAGSEVMFYSIISLSNITDKIY